MDEEGSRDGASLSEEAPWRGPRGGGFFTRDPVRYVKKGSDTGVSLLGGLFLAEGNLESGGVSYTGNFER
jgi:hypothetical protein